MDVIALPGLWGLTPYGALVGLIVYIGLSMSRGMWVPKGSHERELAAANKRGDEWKETALDTRALNNELVKQNSTLVESTKTPAEFFGTVMREGGGDRVGQKEQTET